MKILAYIPLALCLGFFVASAAAKEDSAPIARPLPTDSGRPAKSPAPMPAITRGELLYENHCTGCHESRVHIRDNRRAKSAADIGAWTRRWSNELKLGWSDDDIAEVVRHLSRRYYKFDAPARD